MRKFIIFGVFILLPFYAHGQCQLGQYMVYGSCIDCLQGSYSNTTSATQCSQCPQNYENTWPDANGNTNNSGVAGRDPNKIHIRGESDSNCLHWTCVSGSANYQTGTCDQCTPPANAQCLPGTLDWICNPNFYQNTNQCDPCPTNSETNGAGATSINQCTCNSNNFKYYDRSDSWISSAGCMAAPSGGSNNGWVQTNVNNESVYKCATHATLNVTGTQNPTCTCPNDSSLSGNDCVCNRDYHWTGTTDNFSCTRCPDDSSLVNGTCECNAGYYGDASGTNGSCTKCPGGTKTDNNNSNSRSITDCYMDNNTMFCDGSGNCNTLIRSGYKIKYINITQQ